MPETTTRHRYRVGVGVLGALLAHVLEVWLFAFGYYFVVTAGMFGTLQRNFSATFADCLYFSLTTYATLGSPEYQNKVSEWHNKRLLRDFSGYVDVSERSPLAVYCRELASGLGRVK